MPDGKLYRYCMVQYAFKDGIEHPIVRSQHGNSKTSSTKPYVQYEGSFKECVQRTKPLRSCAQIRER